MVVVNGPIRHEIGMNCGHRRDGAVQPRQRDDRARLRPAVAEPAGRLGARRHLHGLAGQRLHLQQPHLRRERGAQPLGAVARAAAASRPTTAPSASSAAAARRPSASACARNTGASTCATCCVGDRRHDRAVLLLDPITARQFIDRGGFDTKEKLIRLDPRDGADAGGPLLGHAARAELRLSRAPPSARSRWRPGSRRRPTS